MYKSHETIIDKFECPPAGAQEVGRVVDVDAPFSLGDPGQAQTRLWNRLEEQAALAGPEFMEDPGERVAQHVDGNAPVASERTGIYPLPV